MTYPCMAVSMEHALIVWQSVVGDQRRQSCRTPLSCRRCQMRHHRRCLRGRRRHCLQMALQTWTWRAAALQGFFNGATPTSSLFTPMDHDNRKGHWPASSTGKLTVDCHIASWSAAMPA